MNTENTKFKSIQDKNDEAFLSITKLIDTYIELKEEFSNEPYGIFERLFLSKLHHNSPLYKPSSDELNYYSFLFPYELCGYEGAELASIFSKIVINPYERFAVNADNRCSIEKYPCASFDDDYSKDLEKQYENLLVVAYITILFDLSPDGVDPKSKHNLYGKLINLCKKEGIGEAYDISDEYSKGMFGYKLIGRIGKEEVVYTYGKRVNTNINTKLKVVNPKSSSEIYEFLNQLQSNLGRTKREPDDVISIRLNYIEIDSYMKELTKHTKLLDSLKDFNRTIPFFDRRQKNIYKSKIQYAKEDIEAIKQEIFNRINNIEVLITKNNKEIELKAKKATKTIKEEYALANLMAVVNKNAFNRMIKILKFKRIQVKRILSNKYISLDNEKKYIKEASYIKTYFE